MMASAEQFLKSHYCTDEGATPVGGSAKFRAKSLVELKGKIYAAHGWRRGRGESMGRRVGKLYDVSIDNERGEFIATQKALISPADEGEAQP